MTDDWGYVEYPDGSRVPLEPPVFEIPEDEREILIDRPGMKLWTRKKGDDDVTAEQMARDVLERCGVEDAQSFSAGDVVELANLIAELEQLRREKNND